MSALLDELSKIAGTLALEERAQLAQELTESIDQDADPEVALAWKKEIASRIARYERGEVYPSGQPILTTVAAIRR
jgi:putative addiction module component (TIGR02574 family)